MQDIESIRARVDQTASKLAEIETERQERASSLVGMLQRLEGKYARQEEELAYYRERMAPMEKANTELAGLMSRLLDLIDAGFEANGQASLGEAAAIAAQMLDADLPDSVEPAEGRETVDEEGAAMPGPSLEESAEEAAPAETEMEETAMAGEEDVLAAGARFEDVSDAVLELEIEDEAAAPSEDFPSVVTLAVDRARDDGMAGIAETADGEVDIAAVAHEIAAAVSDRSHSEEALSQHNPGASDDIKALLARVEALAAKAELMRAPNAEKQERTEEQPARNEEAA